MIFIKRPWINSGEKQTTPRNTVNDSISIDTYECNGCGSCVALCPNVFQMDAAGEKAEVIAPDTPITAAIEEAAAYCPAGCILLVKGHF